MKYALDFAVSSFVLHGYIISSLDSGYILAHIVEGCFSNAGAQL